LVITWSSAIRYRRSRSWYSVAGSHRLIDPVVLASGAVLDVVPAVRDGRGDGVLVAVSAARGALRAAGREVNGSDEPPRRAAGVGFRRLVRVGLSSDQALVGVCDDVARVEAGPYGLEEAFEGGRVAVDEVGELVGGHCSSC
jgi:hypothetical protein